MLHAPTVVLASSEHVFSVSVHLAQPQAHILYRAWQAVISVPPPVGYAYVLLITFCRADRLTVW